MYYELEEIKYEKIGENTDSEEKQKYWNIAFGLQAVDNLLPSKYMLSLAKENIKGEKSYETVIDSISTYYTAMSKSKVNSDERQADLVSARIVQILDDKSFNFSFLTLKQYHKKLFSGVDVGISGKYVGEFRDYNITKSESILNGKSVIYTDYNMLDDTLKYDFQEEKEQKYSKMDKSKQIERIAEFTSRIWQVHPFGEGNTRTTAVFIQKYLNSKGFEVNNSLFKDNSLFFRNALVRANYSNIKDGIDENRTYLIAFFENLLDNKNNILDNKSLYIFDDDLPLDLTQNDNTMHR